MSAYIIVEIAIGDMASRGRYENRAPPCADTGMLLVDGTPSDEARA